jgi:hypothetical protein
MLSAVGLRFHTYENYSIVITLTSLSFSPSLCTALATLGLGNPIMEIYLTKFVSDSVKTGVGSGNVDCDVLGPEEFGMGGRGVE